MLSVEAAVLVPYYFSEISRNDKIKKEARAGVILE